MKRVRITKVWVQPWNSGTPKDEGNLLSHSDMSWAISSVWLHYPGMDELVQVQDERIVTTEEIDINLF